jgi:L,D-peptidoglycan transpeptidase YkuD (ErfK/YbiS/YcfS/YnhG family)
MRWGRRGGATAIALGLTLTLAACSGGSAPAPTAASSTSRTPAPAHTSEPRVTPSPRSAPHQTPDRTPVKRTQPPRPKRSADTTASAAAPTRRLPLDSSPGDAGQVITVTAPSASNTTATLQAWTKSGDGWHKSGPSVLAHLGSDGMSTDASESKSATPIGSFTLTRAFGHDSNPGTTLPYVQTTPEDWWISQAGPLYNTFQDCESSCAFAQGDPNEHLYYETPFYDYAVVIDYNTANAPGGIKPGKGSAFFLHVTDGNPTAGCVSIAADQLLRLMRWLNPAKHPRIMIGTD